MQNTIKLQTKIRSCLIAFGSAAALISSVASAQTPIPNGGIAQANREISVYKTVNGGYPPGGMPLVKRIRTDAQGYFSVSDPNMAVGYNWVVDFNGAQNATASYAQAHSSGFANNAAIVAAGGTMEGRAIKFGGNYVLNVCDRNSQSIGMLHICKPKMIVEPLRGTGLPSTQ